MSVSGPLSSRFHRSPLKELQLVPLWFLTRRSGMEPCTVNRICLWSDRKSCDGTCQSMMFSRSLTDPRAMSVTSNLPPLQKVGSFPWFRISKFYKFGGFTRASPFCCNWCCPIQFRSIAQVPQVSLMEEHPRNRRAHMRNIQLSVVVPLFPCIL